MLIFIYILETLIYIYFALGCSFKINLNQFEHPNILSIIRIAVMELLGAGDGKPLAYGKQDHTAAHGRIAL